MKRLAVALGLLTAVYAMSLNAPVGAAAAKSNSVSPIRPDIFVPPAANRTPHGSQPSGRFRLGNAPGTEVPSLRTRTSRTFATGDGNLVAKIASEPINYLNPSGQWEPIDNTLVARSGGYRNRGADYSVLLPSRIESAPIRVALGPAWIEYKLLDASGTGFVSRSVERFENALPGVNLEVAARNGGVGWGRAHHPEPGSRAPEPSSPESLQLPTPNDVRFAISSTTGRIDLGRGFFGPDGFHPSIPDDRGQRWSKRPNRTAPHSNGQRPAARDLSGSILGCQLRPQMANRDRSHGNH